MKNYVLGVVDMQPDYEAAMDPRTIAAVAARIKLARENNCPVIFLEVCYFSTQDERPLKPTHKVLYDLVQGYDRFKTAEKLGPDGSWPLQHACKHHGFDLDAFELVGVDTNICFQQTTCRLARALPNAQIRVMTEACNTMTGAPDWTAYADFKNVELCFPGQSEK